MLRLKMKNCNTVLTEKLQKYQHYRLERYRIYKYECLTGEELPSSDQRGMIKQAKFTYSPLEKALEKDWKSLKQLWLMLMVLIIFLVIVLRLNLTKKSETAGADSK